MEKKRVLNRVLFQFLVGLCFLLPLVLAASCGDGHCNNGENCTSCSTDCGSYNCSFPIDCAYVQRANGSYVEYTQFINGGDGVVVLDRNGDGVVAAEDLFGGRGITGRDVDNSFEDLALFDDNGDGVVNESDTNFSDLQIWQRNSTSFELVLLNSTNVSYINLAYRDTGGSDPDIWGAVGTFNSTDFDTLGVAVGVNLTTLNGNLIGGDFLVLDLDNALNVTVTSCPQCSTPVTINLESPANASEETSDSTPSFAFNISDNSAAVNCTLWINSSADLGSFDNNDSVLNATPTTLTANASFSNGEYHWWISCSDDSTAPVNAFESAKRLLTINIAASSTPSSGGGGGGGTLPFWIKTFSEDNIKFEEKSITSKNLSIRHRVKIKINNKTHYVGVISLTNTSATINVSSTPQQAILNIGERKKFNVNADEFYDLLVELISIENDKARLTLNYLHEKVFEEEANIPDESETPQETDIEDETADMPLETKRPSTNIISLVIVILLLAIILAVIVYVKKTKKHITLPSFLRKKALKKRLKLFFR